MAESRELDMTGAKQSTRMWLARVLCYLSLQWAKAQRSEVGKPDFQKSRKDQGKLVSAFEKHQYYNRKDLVDITKQPVLYLKEILKEIGIQNVKGIHKNTWELKPEYRHSQGEEK
ncbi:hypothetical protein Celaphus_00009884, partial [Cervus elaphus hippelaphus]